VIELPFIVRVDDTGVAGGTRRYALFTANGSSARLPSGQ